MPLWASYLVKGYSWRAILDPGSGVLAKTFGGSPGFGITATIIGLAYLWLPYIILPIQAGLERLPDSLLAEACRGCSGGQVIAERSEACNRCAGGHGIAERSESERRGAVATKRGM